MLLRCPSFISCSYGAIQHEIYHLCGFSRYGPSLRSYPTFSDLLPNVLRPSLAHRFEHPVLCHIIHVAVTIHSLQANRLMSSMSGLSCCFPLLVFGVFLFTVGQEYLFPGINEYVSRDRGERAYASVIVCVQASLSETVLGRSGCINHRSTACSKPLTRCDTSDVKSDPDSVFL